MAKVELNVWLRKKIRTVAVKMLTVKNIFIWFFLGLKPVELMPFGSRELARCHDHCVETSYVCLHSIQSTNKLSFEIFIMCMRRKIECMRHCYVVHEPLAKVKRNRRGIVFTKYNLGVHYKKTMTKAIKKSQ